MVDIGGDDSPAAGNLFPDELGGDTLPDGDKLHLGGGYPIPRVVHLGYGTAGLSLERLAPQAGEDLSVVALPHFPEAVAAGTDIPHREFLDVVPI